MRFVFTCHAEKKREDLAKLGIHVKKTLVKSILEKPLHLDTESDAPKKIASGGFDRTRILRIVLYIKKDMV